MAIVFPNEAVARRWNGALQARLLRAPLEEFLRIRTIVPAQAGVSQDSDNLVRATVLIVEGGVELYCRDHAEALVSSQLASVGRMACLVSRALTEFIVQPAAWRVVALVSTTRLLIPWIGLNAAATTSASCVRHFQEEWPTGQSGWDARVSQCATAAVHRAGAEAVAEVSALIAMGLEIPGRKAIRQL